MTPLVVRLANERRERRGQDGIYMWSTVSHQLCDVESNLEIAETSDKREQNYWTAVAWKVWRDAAHINQVAIMKGSNGALRLIKLRWSRNVQIKALPFPHRETIQLPRKTEVARWNSIRFVSTDSSASAGPSKPTLPHEEPPFRSLSTALSAIQPCFGARGDEITILTNPEDFKKTLIDMFKRARRRILVSSLYIGASQDELVRVFAVRNATST